MQPVSPDVSADVLIIESSSPWRSIDLQEAWRYRELLFFFVWRDVKVRYKQTFLGILWAVLQPLFSMLIFAFVFGRVARLPSDGIPYALFAYAGLLPWTFFTNAVTSGALSLVSSANLVSKIYFPRILIPIAAVATGIVDFAIAALMLIPLLFVYRTVPSPMALGWIPAAVLVALMLGFGLSVWLSALVARYRDLRHAVPFATQLWMFATPIVYPLSMMPARWRWVIALNPMTGVVEAFRRSLFGRPVDAGPLLWALLLALALIVTGSIYFRRTERMVADVL
jgi:homopolymeric O-antigen transport system permease protein